MSAGSVTLHNTIVAGNHRAGSDSDIAGIVNSASSHNLIGVGGAGGLVGGINGNQIGVAVAGVLAPDLADNGGPTLTHALIAGANPAVNAGNNGQVPPNGVDQRGFTRVIAGTVDIGAVERDSTASVPTSTIILVTTTDDELDADLSDPGDLSLREAIHLANLAPGADTIGFSAAINGAPILLTLGEIEVTDALTVQGNGAANTIVDGNHATRLFRITSFALEVTLDGMTIRNGHSNNSFPGGGAILSSSIQLTLTNSTLIGNSTSGDGRHGGGIIPRAK